jgi:hypothetical protein
VELNNVDGFYECVPTRFAEDEVGPDVCSAEVKAGSTTERFKRSI